MTLAVGTLAHRYRQRTLLKVASLIMSVTGIAFVVPTHFWPLLLIAAIGTINPSGGDASMFGPIEHSLLTHMVNARDRTALFARYGLISSLIGALGAQSAALPAISQHWLGLDAIQSVQIMFLLYGALGIACLALYSRLSPHSDPHDSAAPAVPLGKSRRLVYTLAAVLSIDALSSGFVVQSLLALWLLDRFQISLVTTGAIFFWTGIFSAISQLIAAPLARRIGLINTMVFTHLPASIILILVPLMPNLPLVLVLLMLRSLTSRLDIPARTSYIMAVVTPGERPAAASITAVTRSLASAIAPMFAGWLLSLSAFGWPLLIGGVLRVIYDALLLTMFRRVRPPEEMSKSPSNQP
jgi:MFS family permease